MVALASLHLTSRICPQQTGKSSGSSWSWRQHQFAAGQWGAQGWRASWDSLSPTHLLCRPTSRCLRGENKQRIGPMAQIAGKIDWCKVIILTPTCLIKVLSHIPTNLLTKYIISVRSSFRVVSLPYSQTNSAVNVFKSEKNVLCKFH